MTPSINRWYLDITLRCSHSVLPTPGDMTARLEMKNPIDLGVCRSNANAAVTYGKCAF
jgi:hypothetical protein